ncbi:AsmA family protein [Denitrificimonas caeni]|uniref:AsmA family protein n=1 Tax=Denitrificimonas caeni TaxID=521720 RepID=UPI0019656FB4|nr:AsmA family protein [Denitrificimonas caeni]
MKSFSKLIGLLLLGVLLLLVAAGFALTHFFDPNDYKDEIRQLARKHANLELELNGDIGWSLFPWLGIEITDAKVASADTPEDPFADLRLLGLSVQVLPLLRKEIQMSDIRIDGLNLSLHRNAKGQGNWEHIGKPHKNPEQATEQQVQDATTTRATESAVAPNTPLKLDINSLIVNGARIDYHDEKSGQQFNLESVQLTTGAIRDNQPIALKFSGFLGNTKPLIRARIELTSKVSIDQALQRYLLDDMKLSGEVAGEPLNGKTANFTVRGNLLYDQSAQVARGDNLKLSINQLKALGELQATQLDKQAQISGALSIAPLNLQEFLSGVGIELPEMADKKALSHFEFNSRLQGSKNSLLFNEMALSIDQTALSGSVGIKDFVNNTLYVQLQGDQLDADRYLPPVKKQAPTERQAEVKQQTEQAGSSGTTALPKTPSQSAWSTEQQLPIERLGKINADLELAFNELTISKFPITQAKLKLLAKQGVITLNNLQGNLFNGEFKTSASVDTKAEPPLLTLKQTTHNIPVEKILQTLEHEVTITGLLDLDTDLRTRGNSQQDWVNHLNGKLDFALHKGVLPDANLERQLCIGIATLNRKALSTNTATRDTAFNELHGKLNIQNGLANNPDLRVAIPGITVKGQGDIDLRVLSLDYYLGIIIEGDTHPMPDPACQVNQRYVGLEWPVRCRGPLELGAKACRIDQEGLGKIAATLAGEKLTEKLNEKLGDKVSPELKDALKGLFKR